MPQALPRPALKLLRAAVDVKRVPLRSDHWTLSRLRVRLFAVLGVAVMALPGAGLIGNAVAADGGSSSSTTTQQAPDFAPTQSTQEQQQPDRDRGGKLCPEKDGEGSGSGSGSGDSSGSSTNPSGTAL